MSTDPVCRRVKTCRTLMKLRKDAIDTFGVELSSNPILDMLFDLFLAHHEQREIYLWSLCMVANTSVATAHRKIAKLARLGMVTREMPARDRRRVGVKMSESGLEHMNRLLDRAEQALNPQPR
jgi:DNA-binding MarR family transcriptional regulator